MRFAIFSTAAEQIAAHARRDAPNEACGLLLGAAGRIETALPAANVAANPADEFEIDPELLLRCHRAARSGGPELLGWYHSHPNGRAQPSAADAVRAIEDGKVWLIATDAGLHGFVSASDGPVEGRFATVDLMLLPPGADE